jgi:hypothetical protein
MTGFVLASLLALASPASAQDAVTETVRLRYVHPLELAQALKLPLDLEQVTLNFREKSVTIRGSRNSVVAAMQQVFEADVEPIVYRVELRVVKRTVDSKGDATEVLSSMPWGSVAPRVPVTFSTGSDEAFGQSVTVKVTPAERGGAKLEVTMRMRDQAGNDIYAASKERIVKLGELVQIGGMTNEKSPALRGAVERGERPGEGAGYTAYFVALRLSIIAGDSSRQPR